MVGLDENLERLPTANDMSGTDDTDRYIKHKYIDAASDTFVFIGCYELTTAGVLTGLNSCIPNFLRWLSE